MKKLKSILPILIPCTSVVAATSIIVPMACLCTQPTHMTRAASERRTRTVKKGQVQGKIDSDYIFTLKDEGININRLSCTWAHTTNSRRGFTINNIALSINAQGKLAANVTARSNDGNNLVGGSTICVNFLFTYKNEYDAVLWTCSFYNNYIVVSK